ncbi:hypothetical protein HDU82_003742, partial [Entophlyctis luteolus]
MSRFTRPSVQSWLKNIRLSVQARFSSKTRISSSAAVSPETRGVSVEPTNAVVDFAEVESDIRAILVRKGYDNGNIGPLLVRLAWHCAGTFDANDGSGGSNGARMRLIPEAEDPANAGLDVARNFLEPIKRKHEHLSYADLWTFAGVVAVHALGGPRAPWKPGREDLPALPDTEQENKASASKCPAKHAIPNGRLPDAALGAAHLRAIFYRMGFGDREIVALSGAHCLGMCHVDRSGYDGVWTHTPNEFSNKFFKELLESKWRKRDWDDWTGPEQYMDETEILMMLPTDMALVWDQDFKVFVEEYAQNQDKFFE